MAKRLIPSFNRVLVEKIVPPTKTNSGVLLPESTTKVKSFSLSLSFSLLFLLMLRKLLEKRYCIDFEFFIFLLFVVFFLAWNWNWVRAFFFLFTFILPFCCFFWYLVWLLFAMFNLGLDSGDWCGLGILSQQEVFFTLFLIGLCLCLLSIWVLY